jgi:hypothetical protein
MFVVTHCQLEHNNVMMVIILMVMAAMLIVLLAITIAAQLQLFISTLIQETALRLVLLVIFPIIHLMFAMHAFIPVEVVPIQIIVIAVLLAAIGF